jgi:hypothetical protein
MKRYVKIYREPSIITFPTRQEAEGIDYYSIINPKFDVVRILSAEEEKEFEGMKLDWIRFQTWKSHLAGFLLSHSKHLQPEKNYDLDIELIEYCKRLEQFDKKEFAWEWYKKCFGKS